MQKAINGNFTHDKYFDRSITNVGDRLNLSNIEPLQTQDADLVKTKLEVARSHHKAKIANQTTTDIGPILWFLQVSLQKYYLYNSTYSVIFEMDEDSTLSELKNRISMLK